MFGSVNEYFYKYLAGIHAPTDEDTTVGYKKIHIKPYVPEQMSWAEASVGTVYGQVSSGWENKENGLTLIITIPANTSGKISIPTLGHGKVLVSESGKTIWQDGKLVETVEGISEGQQDDLYIVFEVLSGMYQFVLSRTN